MAESTYQKSLLFTPEGVRDIYGEDCEKRYKIQNELHNTMKLYGFKDIETPVFEFFDIFNHERGTVNSKEMFKFFDQYNNTLVLRPDITPSIARCVAKYYEKEDMQIRLCYTGSTFIHRSGYQGKLAQTTQVGAELMNDDSSDADGEMIAMTIECLIKSGLKEFKVDIGHADLFRGLVEEATLTEEEIEQLKVYMANKNIFAVEDMLEKKEIPSECKDLLIKLPDLFGDIETIQYALERTSNERAREALDRLEKIDGILKAYGMENHVTFDLGMLSHYEYYTGIIFKAYTYGTGDAIVTGGRYDNLVEQFGKKTPAIGLAFVLDELMLALESQQVNIDAREADILILYRSANRERAIELGNELRTQKKPVRLMRKNAETPLESYKEYGLRNEVSSILYIDDTGEVTEFALRENGG
ncbi:MAG: ATP phosphoribosyltransferase regulatory subunit [Lachnospiraceae bacterium]|nr:ATP phosphoribosyltransferase regulatory subunit [Lachnospiraceae bacterium]